MQTSASHYLLAQKKKLPLNQVIDPLTSFWCYINYAGFLGYSKEKLLSDLEKRYKEIRPYLSEYYGRYSPIIGLSLIYKDSRKDSIHGINHHFRTSIIAWVLARESKTSTTKTDGMVLAALLHDVFRNNDKDDFEHGKRSSEWYKDNHKLATKIFIKSKPVKILSDEVAEALELHDVDLESTKNNTLLILKKADSLDRFRLPKLTWWPNKDKAGGLISYNQKDFILGILLNILIPEYKNNNG